MVFFAFHHLTVPATILFIIKFMGIRHISPQNVASIVTTVVITKLTLLKNGLQQV